MPPAYPHWESNTQHSYLSFRIPTRQILFFSFCKLLCNPPCPSDPPFMLCPAWSMPQLLSLVLVLRWVLLLLFPLLALWDGALPDWDNQLVVIGSLQIYCYSVCSIRGGFFCQGSSWWFQGFLGRRNHAVRQTVCNYNPPTRSLCVRKTQIEGVICAKTCGLCTNSATRMWKPTAFIWLYLSQTSDFF